MPFIRSSTLDFANTSIPHLQLKHFIEKFETGYGDYLREGYSTGSLCINGYVNKQKWEPEDDAYVYDKRNLV